ncbi:MAG: hypothetical protein IJF04_07735 [Oscillospiraceae bacterium]|nr:hypothetical protein [Oscillospiraceae bacterium]MBQ3237413.1 hypothetical protein [Oscillospiraceae bacterium]
MEFLKNLNKKLFEDNKNKKLIWIVLAGCIGILMISVSELTANDNSEYTERKDQYAFFAEDQVLMLETKLEEKISEISGAGKTSVMITADSSKEYFYAENHSENSEEKEKSIEREFVVIEGENGDEPIVLKIKESKIRGVLVICEGGDNPVIKEKIIEAVCALLDVSSNSVSVAKMA